ncbi:copper resistance D family protein [Exiguobacterium sp. RIT594]|uniref:copper resistance D family protein n=1 Tax=Exiguobacterium sp. RIT594 TaxID=2282449 RepID=UPI0011C01EC6|nr:CopD family protein [Exiguobacterium sp. RIT594]
MKFALFLLLAMVGTLAWSGHASSITGAEGLLVHTAHALSVFIWTGGLLVLGYSNASNPRWDNVLEWFRPLVTLCFLIILGSGIYLMSVVVKVDDYPNSWILPYGQALLWKHVLILPVLIIGFMNGKWSYASSKQTLKVKQMRMRMEGTLILFIFAATALLGQQEPPHSVEDTLKSSGAGQLSAFVFPNLRFEYSNIEFEPGMTSVLFLVIGLLFGGLVVFLIRKTNESIKTLFLGLGMSVSLFLAFLYSISLTF